MLFPRTIRLDDTDIRVFTRAAEPLEWAISGSFMFLNETPQSLTGKHRQAFNAGFLGTTSFGWSSVVMVARISDEEAEGVARRLANFFVEEMDAPDLGAALAVARQEVVAASEICAHPVGTLLAIERELKTEGVVERFRQLPAGADHGALKLWAMVNDERTF